MSYISFNKKQLVNLEYSLRKEILRTNRAGAYASTSIIRCNTRKYHGLLVAPQPQLDNQQHVFLSTLDVSVIQRNAIFNLGIHKYKDDVYEPGGHKYIREFESDPIPKLTYRVGGVILTTEMAFATKEDRILIKYTVEKATSPTTLRFRPFMNFRNVHALSRANDYADKSFEPIKNGIKVRMYDNYPHLHIQFSKKPDYNHAPDWYYDIEYMKERSRGYEYKEDLYTPGYFDVPIKKGESIIFSASLADIQNRKLAQMFDKEVETRIPRNTFKNCLENAADQFFVTKNNKTEMIAGYHWFGFHGRDTFVALPGLTLVRGDNKTFLEVVDNMVQSMQGPFFPNSRLGNKTTYNAVDTPLWFFWALQQYVLETGRKKAIWTRYGDVMKLILESYKNGTDHNIHMLENGLLYAGFDNDALTWMNAIINGNPVVNRNGLAVEVNALWYNAIRFYHELAAKYGSTDEAEEWNRIAGAIEINFTDHFWDESKGYLADVVKGDFRDFRVRPNQLFATSLPYSPISDEIKYLVLHKVEQDLLTPRGIRTLSPKNPDYQASYKGNITQRDTAYHQGSALPWLLGHFAEGYLKIHNRSGEALIRKILDGFEEEMNETGIGAISELFSGNPPFRGKGAISQAWSVSELLRINHMLEKLKHNQ